MKKLFLLFFITIIFLLNGCSANKENIDAIINEALNYNWPTMSFTNTPKSDLLYSVNNTYSDFHILHDEVMDNKLTLDEQKAYKQLFDIIDQLVIESNTNYEEITSFKSKDFKELCDAFLIEIKTEDVVSFNSLKSLITEIKNRLQKVSFSINKMTYIEKRLNKTLSKEEINSIKLLQRNYYQLYTNYDIEFDFSSDTLDSLLLKFKENTGYEPTPEELIQIEVAFDIVTKLINN